jgi:putative ABC transport system ATP-binding protein
MGDVLSLRRVTKTYRRGVDVTTALADASLTLPAGAIVALTGPSGGGKSTLLSLVAGFSRPDSGEIRVGDFDVTAATPAQMDSMRTRLVGFVFQQFHLVQTLTALENVALGLCAAGVASQVRRKSARDVLLRLGLDAEAERRPAQLSGGQQQRVAIARALVGSPKVVLADEPTAALDARTAATLMDQLAALARDAGVLMLIATHDQRCMERADRVLVLENGILTS